MTESWPGGLSELLGVVRPRQLADAPGRLVLTCHHSVRSELARYGLNEPPRGQVGSDYHLVEFDVPATIAAGYWRLLEDGEVVGDGYVPLRNAENWQIFKRDAGRCARCGKPAESCHHRVHGRRRDRRPSNLLSLCGDGTSGCHGWVEAHWDAAAERGWTVSTADPWSTPAVKVWYEAGPLGRGDMILDDLLGINIWQPPEEETTDG